MLIQSIADLLAFFRDHNHALQGLYYVAASLSFLGAFATYIANSRRIKRQLEADTYRKVNEQFLRYSELIIQNPGLDVGYDDSLAQKSLTQEEKIQQHAMFDIFASMAENAYVAYHATTSLQRERQWAGWQEYIERYCSKESFRSWWLSDRRDNNDRDLTQFDKSFQGFMDAAIDRAKQNRNKTFPSGQ